MQIIFNGRNVFMGYLNDEEKTKEALTDDLLLRSGDLGKRDIDGYGYITGLHEQIQLHNKISTAFGNV